MADSYTVSPAADRLARSAALGEDVSRLKYVSGAREEALHRLGIKTVEDLFLHIPHRYLDFSHAYRIEDAPLGEVCTVVGTVDRITDKPHARVRVTEVSLVDETGVLQVAFFKQPWIARQLQRGDRLAVMGKVEFAYGFKQMASPHFEKADGSGSVGAILPVHYLSEGLSAAWMRRIVSAALETFSCTADPLPARLRARRGLMSAARAYRSIHFPSTLGEKDLARRRLAYEETLLLQLALRLRNDANLLDVHPYAHATGEHVDALRAALPFALSDEQDAAVGEILADMANGERVMNRLLLGDVGTGKTAVACFGLASAADTGTQACVMAPTSVLAQQYAVKCGPLLEAAGITWALLTGATPADERASITARLRSGELTVLFGTHAVLSDDVVFRRLSLVVIDEQHRFGVNQRNALRAKGPGADLLVMTATPIPRTLALSVYGDLDTSIIRHRPVPGAGVETKVLTEPNRDIAYGAVREALAAGRQVYVICPLVEPTDQADDLEDVPGLQRDEDGHVKVPVPLHDCATEADRLSHVFKDARIAVLHGRMNAHDKDEAIARFRAGETDVLVSTTVIEVGVDVPNATVMVIENAERYGLSALHQLRGRVGRGAAESWCFLVSDNTAESVQKRLKFLCSTADGFSVAQFDLETRGPGDFFGSRQHGLPTLQIADLMNDTRTLHAAQAEAVALLAADPLLEQPEHALLAAQVEQMFEKAGAMN